MGTDAAQREGEFRVENQPPAPENEAEPTKPEGEGDDGAAGEDDPAELKRQIKKLQDENKGLKTRRQPYEELADRIEGRIAVLDDRITALDRSKDEMAKALGTGDVEDLPQKLEQISGETTQRIDQKKWDTYKSRMADSFSNALSGVPGVSIETDDNGKRVVKTDGVSDDAKDAIHEAVTAYMEAERAKDGQEMGVSLANVHSIALRVEREQAKSREEEARKEGQRRRQQQDSVEMGGPGRTGSGASDQDWIDEYADEANGRIPPTPANAARARELMQKGLRARVRTR